MKWKQLAAMALVELHTPTDQLIVINPKEMSSLIDPRQFESSRHFIEGTRCVVVMSNGRLNATSEPCEAVEKLIKETN